jgi:hypothetical protein
MSPWNRCLVYLDPKYTFLYQSPATIQKVVYALDVTETAGHQAGRVSLYIDVVF